MHCASAAGATVTVIAAVTGTGSGRGTGSGTGAVTGAGSAHGNVVMQQQQLVGVMGLGASPASAACHLPQAPGALPSMRGAACVLFMICKVHMSHVTM
jgi:hypothetical protein